VAVAALRSRLATAAAVAAAAAAAVALPAPTAEAASVWLCRPGLASNPCEGSQRTTVFAPDGSSRVEDPPTGGRPVDCFYVYPTVSNQLGRNATRSIDPEQRAIAMYQAARFSRHCRVFAPIYRQTTLLSLFTRTATPEARQLAYSDVVDAWREYLRDDNRGRGVVLIGHSQGTGMLRRLVHDQIDPRPELRRLLVSGILLGSNVTVRVGSDRGGDFRNVPVCTRDGQAGCVIAFSTFGEPPPEGARFGRPARAPDPVTGLPGGPGYEVACVNPGSIGPNAVTVGRTLIRSEPFPLGLLSLGIYQLYGGVPPRAETPWLVPRDRYAGRCERVNGAHVLIVHPVGDSRELNPSPDASWGYHLVDVNGALGDLERAVEMQTATYLRGLRGRARIGVALRYRRGRLGRRSCARPPLRVGLSGRDRALVRRAEFRLDGRRVARDSRPPLRARIGASRRLRRGRVARVGVAARLADGRLARASKRVRICR
jgi:hypothetical protein